MHYILFDCYDSTITPESLEKLSQCEEIHVRCDSNIDHTSFTNIMSNLAQLNTTCYVYVFDVYQHDIALQHGLIPHICFINEGIFDDSLMHCTDNKKENFWIIDNSVLSQDINQYINRLQKLNIPICMVISSLLYPAGTYEYEKLRLFIKAIHAQFNNPLYHKEMGLHVSSYTQHYYLQQKQHQCSMHQLVMGMFGDVVVYDNNIAAINMKKMMKTVDCMNCALQDKCVERGIGYIMHTLQLHGCASYQLMKPEN